MVTLLDHGYLKVIPEGCWGADQLIIESARMSTDKGFQGWGPLPCPTCGGEGEYITHTARSVSPMFTGGVTLTPCIKCHGSGEVPGDEKLLTYLYRKQHMTPFEMAGATIEVQAPIFVFREWQRHRTQSFSELSARYTELPDLFYVPSLERLQKGGQDWVNKQSSGAGIHPNAAKHLQRRIARSYEESRSEYDRLLKDGLSRELARMVIPVAQYSRMRASANLRNWLGFLELRQAEGAQWEIRQFANALHQELKARFPRTMELFDE